MSMLLLIRTSSTIFLFASPTTLHINLRTPISFFCYLLFVKFYSVPLGEKDSSAQFRTWQFKTPNIVPLGVLDFNPPEAPAGMAKASGSLPAMIGYTFAELAGEDGICHLKGSSLGEGGSKGYFQTASFQTLNNVEWWAD